MTTAGPVKLERLGQPCEKCGHRATIVHRLLPPPVVAALNAAREAAGLTRAEVGRRAGISEKHAQAIFGGQVRPSADVAVALTDVLPTLSVTDAIALMRHAARGSGNGRRRFVVTR